MQQILGHGIAIHSNVDVAFGLLALVYDLVGKAEFETGVPV